MQGLLVAERGIAVGKHEIPPLRFAPVGMTVVRGNSVGLIVLILVSLVF